MTGKIAIFVLASWNFRHYSIISDMELGYLEWLLGGMKYFRSYLTLRASFKFLGRILLSHGKANMLASGQNPSQVTSRQLPSQGATAVHHAPVTMLGGKTTILRKYYEILHYARLFRMITGQHEIFQVIPDTKSLLQISGKDLAVTCKYVAVAAVVRPHWQADCDKVT